MNSFHVAQILPRLGAKILQVITVLSIPQCPVLDIMNLEITEVSAGPPLEIGESSKNTDMI